MDVGQWTEFTYRLLLMVQQGHLQQPGGPQAAATVGQGQGSLTSGQPAGAQGTLALQNLSIGLLQTPVA